MVVMYGLWVFTRVVNVLVSIDISFRAVFVDSTVSASDSLIVAGRMCL
jgi:hypothetical protein